MNYYSNGLLLVIVSPISVLYLTLFFLQAKSISEQMDRIKSNLNKAAGIPPLDFTDWKELVPESVVQVNTINCCYYWLFITYSSLFTTNISNSTNSN